MSYIANGSPAQLRPFLSVPSLALELAAAFAATERNRSHRKSERDAENHAAYHGTLFSDMAASNSLAVRAQVGDDCHFYYLLVVAAHHLTATHTPWKRNDRHLPAHASKISISQKFDKQWIDVRRCHVA
jgi:hypothetical protein